MPLKRKAAEATSSTASKKQKDAASTAAASRTRRKSGVQVAELVGKGKNAHAKLQSPSPPPPQSQRKSTRIEDASISSTITAKPGVSKAQANTKGTKSTKAAKPNNGTAARKGRGRPSKSASSTPGPDAATTTRAGKAGGRPARAPKSTDVRSTDTVQVEIQKALNEDPAENEDEENDGRGYWLMKAEPESRIENGVDVKFSIDDLAAKNEPEPWDGKFISFWTMISSCNSKVR